MVAIKRVAGALPLVLGLVLIASAAGEQLPAGRQLQLAVFTSHLDAKLGNGFAGVWRSADGEQRVGVTSPSAARAVHAAAARAGLAHALVTVPRRSSWSALITAQESWNKRLAPLFEREEVMTSIDPPGNAVQIELGSAVSPLLRALLERQARLGGVRVDFVSARVPTLSVALQARCRGFEKNKAFCDPTIAAGVSIRNEVPFPCTAGPQAIRKNFETTETTETFLLTAGHCTETVGEIWSSFTKLEEERTIGKSLVSMVGKKGDEVDVGLIKIESAGWQNANQTPVNAAGAVWNELESEPLPIIGQRAPEVGFETCHSGQTTGQGCGTISAVNVTIGPPGEQLKELVKVPLSPKSDEGDSGGPYYSTVEEGGGLLIEGTHVGRIEGTNIAVFEPISYDFERLETKGYDLELLTKANETRPKCPMENVRCFFGETYPVTLTGAQTGTDEFTIDEGKVSCSSVTSSGSLSESSEVLELSPTYSGCTAFGFLSVPIDVNGCKYQFTSGEKVEGNFEGSVHIVCPKEKSIELTGPGCTVTVGSQTPTGGKVTYTNVGSGTTRELKIDVALTGIHYIEDPPKKGSTCRSPGETTTNGTYSGQALVTGENASKVHKGIWIE